MTDYDTDMSQAIEMAFDNTTHMICQWHMLQHFKKTFVYLSKRKSANSKLLYNHIVDTIFCESPTRFQELIDLIFTSSNEMEPSKLAHLR